MLLQLKLMNSVYGSNQVLIVLCLIEQCQIFMRPQSPNILRELLKLGLQLQSLCLLPLIYLKVD